MSVDVSTLAISVKSDGISELSSKLSGLTTSAKNAEKAVGAFEKAMTKLEQTSRTATGQADLFLQKMMAQENVLKGLSTSTGASASATHALAKAMAELSTSIRTVVIHNEAATRAQHSHNNSMKEAHALARGLSGSLGALWVTYGNLAGMALGIAIGASLKGIISVGKDVENTLEGIRVRAGESFESMSKVAEAVERIGQGVYGPQEVAKAFETL